MRRPTIAAIAAVSTIALTQIASAADLPRKAPAYTPPPPPPAFSWTGCYLGGYVGGAGQGGNGAEFTDLGNTTRHSFSGGVSASNIVPSHSWNVGDSGASFIGGGTLGYNWQFAGSPFVIGVEGEFGYIHLNGSGANPASPALNTIAESRVGDWYGVLAGRLGWAGVPNWLFYVKGGAVWTELHANVIDSCTVFPCGPATVNASGSTTTTGWTVGGGAEWMFAPRWSVKAEYLFLGIDETVRACGPGGGTGAGKTFCWDHDFQGVHTAKVGINYHF